MSGDEKVGPECFGGEDPPHNTFNAALAVEALRVAVDQLPSRPSTPTISIERDALRHMLAENDRLTAQVTELQAAASKAKNESLYRRVRAFHERFGHPIRHTPAVPSEDEVRFRLSLIAEEFRELLTAGLDLEGLNAKTDEFDNAWEVVQSVIRGVLRDVYTEDDEDDEPVDLSVPVRVDFEAFYDALLDLAYVIEGTHAVCGTRAEPGLAEVQRANMAKSPVYVAEKDGTHRFPPPAGGSWGRLDPTQKPRKPDDWTPPNIRAVLIAQGWTPPPSPGVLTMTVDVRPGDVFDVDVSKGLPDGFKKREEP